HRLFNVPIYIGIYLVICGFYDAFFLVQSYSFVAANPNAEVNCIIPDTMPDYIANIWFEGCIAINAITVASYALVWVGIKLKSGSQNDAMKRVFKSLSVIMVVVVVGWTINAIVRVSLPHTGIDPFYFFFVGTYFGIPVNAACASHMFVLYMF
ncbi:Protein SRSX-34 c, partial [Aphelenchoides avenae]